MHGERHVARKQSVFRTAVVRGQASAIGPSPGPSVVRSKLVIEAK